VNDEIKASLKKIPQEKKKPIDFDSEKNILNFFLLRGNFARYLLDERRERKKTTSNWITNLKQTKK
jgi:hypothetical protein